METNMATFSSGQATANGTAFGLYTSTSGNYWITFRNESAEDAVYLGSSGVTTSTGYALLPGQSVTMEIFSSGQVLYGITDGGSVTVSWLTGA